MVCEILPNIWIGNKKDASDINFLINKGIKCIINTTKTCPYPDFKNYVLEKIRIPLNEMDSNNNVKNNVDMYDYLLNLTEFIKDKNSNFKPILIFCTDGIQRTPTIIAAYIIRYGNVTIDFAIKSIKSKYINSFIDEIYFYIALQKFYIYINNIKN